MDEQGQAGEEGYEEPTVEPVRPAGSSRRGLRFGLGSTALIAIFITAVIVGATAIVLVAGQAQEASYPADSPEAALQNYLRAWYDQDTEAQYGYFSERVKDSTSLGEYESQYCCYYESNETVRIDRVTGSGNVRTITVSIDRYYGGSSSYTDHVSVPMVLEAGGWRIDQLMHGLERYESF